MSGLADEVQGIFESQVVEWCDRAFTHAAMTMRKDMERAGLDMTKDLVNSVFSERSFVTGNLEAAFRLGMKGYGRFKDMKVLKYDDFRPKPDGDLIRGMERFVEKKGVSSFKYVPGYFTDVARRSAVSDSRAKNRIAWGIAMNIIKRGRQTRKSPFYNVNRGKIYSDIKEYIMTRLPTESMAALKRFYETPVYDLE